MTPTPPKPGVMERAEECVRALNDIRGISVDEDMEGAEPGRDIILETLNALIDECAEVAETTKPGWSIDVFTGALGEDRDGPWGLGSDFASAIRSLKEN